MYFKQIFDEKLAQYAYLIGCQATNEAIVIDPMRDIDQYLELAQEEELEITAAAETHIHADFLSGLRAFAERGVHVYASDEGNENWKYEWLKDSPYHFTLLHHGDRFSVGNIVFSVMRTPGHTPEHISFIVTDQAGADQPMGILTGDFIFVGDVGRPDLLETAAGEKGAMKSSAKALYQSVQQFKELPDYLQLWPGHGAGSACGKALGAVPESTVGYELRFNASIREAGSEQQFVDYILEGQPEPPLYFARMKRDNRQGPPLLKALPRPAQMAPEELIRENADHDGVIVDTRPRTRFMDSHLAGSLLAPFDKQFNTTAASYIREDERIYLIIEEEDLEQAVRDLVRVGLDHIAGFTSPGAWEQFLEDYEGKELIERISFREADRLRATGYQVVDVRRASEFEEGHLPGAINIAHTRLLDRMDELPADKTLLVHCKSGKRASVASALLKKHGFNVQFIDDEIESWLQEVTS